jgi:hypothetical protein
MQQNCVCRSQTYSRTLYTVPCRRRKGGSKWTIGEAPCRNGRRGEWRINRARIAGLIAFSVELEPDPDGAAIALRKAGFTITRLPARFWHLLIPGDDFLYAVTGGAITDDYKILGAVMNEINVIVRDYGGGCSECGFILADCELSFDELFDQRKYWPH